MVALRSWRVAWRIGVIAGIGLIVLVVVVGLYLGALAMFVAAAVGAAATLLSAIGLGVYGVVQRRRSQPVGATGRTPA